MSRRRAQRAGEAHLIDRAIAALLRAPATLARLLRSLWSYLGTHARARIALIITLIALPLLGGGWLWLRHSSLVAVEHVHVSGVHGAEARAIERALKRAGRGMSTLDVQQGKLRAAVASYPVVGSLRVQASFPHGLKIAVVEQPPVATLSAGGAQTAVAANGVVLGTAHVSSSLPTLKGPVQLSPGEHVQEVKLLGELTVLGAAPRALAKWTESAYSGSRGLTLVMRSGLRAYFGDASRPHAKWAALARVLADSGSAGAAYVDVRVPERPAAGFPEGVTPPAIEGAVGEAESSTVTGGESAESLAESLAAAVPDSSSSLPAGVTEAGAGSESEASQESSEAPPASAENVEQASVESPG
jgi:cell division protein FtsQ